MQENRVRVHTPATRFTGKYILYWMQQAQRAQYNPALEYAIQRSTESSLPLIVVFVFSAHVPDANLRHYSFMIQGLKETAATISSLGIDYYFCVGLPLDVISKLGVQALEVVTDHGYLHYQREWRSDLQSTLKHFGTGYSEIETEALVPVSMVSDKEEYSAATLRRKLLRVIDQSLYARDLPVYQAGSYPLLSTDFPLFAYNPQAPKQLEHLLENHLSLDTRVSPVASYTGGYSKASEKLHSFLHHKLKLYATHRNHPDLDIQSGLSPYLHFGQISTMEIVQQLLEFTGISLLRIGQMIADKASLAPFEANVAAFMEELLIRRELSFNFCQYNADYDNFSCLPDWARQSLMNHLDDPRPVQYSLDRLEQCATNDVYWNAAQQEMMETGKMHNYMRMYWGKRIIAWFDSPENAYQATCYLNNRYELDGRDPNAFAGIAWCYGQHDRPWQNRSIYGAVRFMNAAGLERKFDMQAYLKKVGVK